MKKYIDKLCTENNPEAPTMLEERSIPKGWRTAYPRRQDDCEDPSTGLASIEAIAIAYLILDRDPTGLFDNYHWKSDFLKINAAIGSKYPGFTHL
jgi:pre-rRNA-processing protein TSR3